MNSVLVRVLVLHRAVHCKTGTYIGIREKYVYI
jgi:hypothetical protein